jgi:hypothetical protein
MKEHVVPMRVFYQFIAFKFPLNLVSHSIKTRHSALNSGMKSKATPQVAVAVRHILGAIALASVSTPKFDA